MDVTRLVNATAIGNRDVPQGRKTEAAKPVRQEEPKRKVSQTDIDKKRVQAALDRIIRNTRFQYVLTDEPDYFIVRIIDKDTDKVIREIPSKELQKVHEGIEEAIGILFDREI